MRWMLGVESIPAMLYFVLLWFVPNSPRWLIMKGREEEGLNLIRKFNEESEVVSIFDQIKASFRAEKLHPIQGLNHLFSSKYRKILIIGLVIGIAQMSVGINAIFFYAPSIFELTGMGTDAAFTQAIWVGIINVVFTFVAILLIDRIGRRTLLLSGIFGIAVSLLTICYGFKAATYTISKEQISQLSEEFPKEKLVTLLDQIFDSDLQFSKALASHLSTTELSEYKGDLLKLGAKLNPLLILLGILGFVACFAFSLGPVMWVMLSEIFPNQIRGISISFIGFINSLTSYFVVHFFPWELDVLGNVMTFGIYAGFSILALFIMYRILPETKGKSLEELELAL